MQKLLLATDMVVERAGRQSDARRELSQTHRREPALGNQIRGTPPYQTKRLVTS